MKKPTVMQMDREYLKPARNGYIVTMTIGLILLWYYALVEGRSHPELGITVFSGLGVYFASILYYRRFYLGYRRCRRRYCNEN